MIRTRTLECSGSTYTALEAGEGPLVLCVHGFPDQPSTFSAQLEALAEAGFWAVAPTLRGYEPSTAHLDRQMRSLIGDVPRWLDALEQERCHLVGHDWGATIGYAAASTFPERISSLTTLSVPHLANMMGGLLRCPSQVLRMRYISLFQLRGFAERYVRRHRMAYLQTLIERWSPGWTMPPEHLESIRARMMAPGVLRAVLDYYRYLQRRTALDTLRLLAAPVPVRTLAIYGDSDGVMLQGYYTAAWDPSKFTAALRIERLEGVGHFPQLERPELVNRLLVEWVNAQEA